MKCFFNLSAHLVTFLFFFVIIMIFIAYYANNNLIFLLKMNEFIYLIVGGGRLASQLQHYFSLKNIAYNTWKRQDKDDLQSLVVQSDIVLLAISDDAIEPFWRHHQLHNKTCVHFSGALHVEGIFSFHPLMTFGHTLYSLEQLESILFVHHEQSSSFQSIFPSLPNLSIQIKAEQQAYYHALCVIANNFTTLLWQKFFHEMESTFKAPAEPLHLYLQQTCDNLNLDYKTALTGPLCRHDTQTISRNLQALSADPIQEIYQSFIDYYQEISHLSMNKDTS